MKRIFYIAFFISMAFNTKAQSLVPLGDPFIILHDGKYYAYGTHAANGIAVYVSNDLLTWKVPVEAKNGLALYKDDVWGDHWFWAPEVYYVNGKFYMYYSAAEHICVAVSDSPTGPFVQTAKKPMIEDEKCIDNSLFIDNDGKAYLSFVRFTDGNNIWIAEMADDLVTIKKETMKPCIHVSQAWEEVWPRVNEGSFIVKHKGVYYMTYSANSYESPFYGVGIATAKNVMGPWKKYEHNPILQKPGNLFGVGHNAMFTDKEGQLRIVFHAHNSETEIHPRTMHIAKVLFEGKDGKNIMEIDDILTPTLENQPEKVRDTFTNPVWNGADPWMVKQGDDYIYCFAAKKGIKVSRSKLMTQRGETREIWSAPKTGWNKSCIWAPEIHFIDGHWYVYYAAGESGPPYIHQRTGVLRSKTADVFSEYEDMGMLNTGDDPTDISKNIWAIDMTVFEHAGKLYAVWSGWQKQVDTDATPQHLYIQEMENPSTLKGKRVLLSSPEESWETGGPLNLNEGPEVLKHGDQVFIVYSCRESWLKEYRQGMLQLKSLDADPLDPKSWKKKGPVFGGNETVFGVGHVSFVKSPDGTEDWIIYHSKKGTEPGWNRDVRMQPFTWNSDGIPNFGEALKTGIPIKCPSGEIEIERAMDKK